MPMSVATTRIVASAFSAGVVAPPHGSGAQAPECLAPPRPQEVVLRVG